MAKVKVIDKDRGWNKIVKDLTAMKSAPYVKVGLVGPNAEAIHSDSSESISVATIGLIHEFGSESRNIPERSFIRGPLDAHIGEIREGISNLSSKLIFQKITLDQALGILGLLGVKIIKNAITVDRIPPPLNPKTIEAKTRDGKSGDTPLVDTAQMLNSVRHQVVLSGRDDE